MIDRVQYLLGGIRAVRGESNDVTEAEHGGFRAATVALITFLDYFLEPAGGQESNFTPAN